MSKFPFVFLCFLLVSFCFVGLVNAEALIVEYNYSYYGSSLPLRAVHPSSTTSYSAYGESFLVPVGYNGTYVDVNLTSVVFWLYKDASPNATLQVWLMSHKSTSTYGYNGVPNATLAVSDTLNSTVLTGSNKAYRFNFTAYPLLVGVPYVVVIVVLNGNVSSFHQVNVARSKDYPVCSGNQQSYQSSAWQTTGYSYDVCFQIFGDYTVASSGYSESDLSDYFWFGVLLVVVVGFGLVMVVLRRRKLVR